MASHDSSFYANGDNKEAVMDTCMAALIAMGANIQTKDLNNGYIMATTGLNLMTTGETIEVRVMQERSPGRFVIKVSSSTSQPIAWGKNQQNVQAFEEQFNFYYPSMLPPNSPANDAAQPDDPYAALSRNMGNVQPYGPPAEQVNQEADDAWMHPDSNDYYEPFADQQQAPSVTPQPNVMVDYMQSIKDKPAAQPQIKAPRIFMSYRRADSADVTGRMYDRLVAAFGKEAIFKDVDSIPFGVNFAEYLDQQVQKCDLLLAIIGKDWASIAYESGDRRLHDPKDFVRIEIESALKRDIPVIPILVRGASMPTASDLPDSLQDLLWRNGTQVRSDPDFHNDMNRLIDGIKGQ